MERIEMYVGCGERLNDMHKELNKYYVHEKARREKAGVTEDFVVYAVFNGAEILHTDTPDEISVKVTGKTIAEREAAERNWRKELDRQEREHQARIPELTEKYKKEARGVIPEDKLELWDKIVPIRLKDLYRGMELEEWLKMIRVLNEDKPKEERFAICKEIFYNAGHSGMSGNLVLSGLCEFHPDGKELAELISK